METETLVIRNKGQRTYTLPPGADGSKRYLEPSKTMEVTQAEARQHLNYSDIEDAAVAVPQATEHIARLTAENAALRAARDAKLALIKPDVPLSVPVQASPATVPEPENGKAAVKPEAPAFKPLNVKQAGKPTTGRPAAKRKAGR